MDRFLKYIIYFILGIIISLFLNKDLIEGYEIREKAVGDPTDDTKCETEAQKITTLEECTAAAVHFGLPEVISQPPRPTHTEGCWTTEFTEPPSEELTYFNPGPGVYGGCEYAEGQDGAGCRTICKSCAECPAGQVQAPDNCTVCEDCQGTIINKKCIDFNEIDLDEQSCKSFDCKSQNTYETNYVKKTGIDIPDNYYTCVGEECTLDICCDDLICGANEVTNEKCQGYSNSYLLKDKTCGNLKQCNRPDHCCSPPVPADVQELFNFIVRFREIHKGKDADVNIKNKISKIDIRNFINYYLLDFESIKSILVEYPDLSDEYMNYEIFETLSDKLGKLGKLDVHSIQLKGNIKLEDETTTTTTTKTLLSIIESNLDTEDHFIRNIWEGGGGGEKETGKSVWYKILNTSNSLRQSDGIYDRTNSLDVNDIKRLIILLNKKENKTYQINTDSDESILSSYDITPFDYFFHERQSCDLEFDILNDKCPDLEGYPDLDPDLDPNPDPTKEGPCSPECAKYFIEWWDNYNINCGDHDLINLNFDNLTSFYAECQTHENDVLIKPYSFNDNYYYSSAILEALL